ncbi:MAG: glycosyltransferase [Acidobacteria bacterium]|nr:glycosyltransferase [Acidobacteriota bacterium]
MSISSFSRMGSCRLLGDPGIVSTWFHPDAAQEHCELEVAEAEPKAGLCVVVCTYCRPQSVNRFIDSLSIQQFLPERLIVVDASSNEETESAIKSRTNPEACARHILYFRVSADLRGLTRQRNFALRWVTTDAVAFFDDDIVLAPGCLLEMDVAFRTAIPSVAGIVPLIENDAIEPGLIWRIRELLGMVADLRPGSYQRSGISIDVSFAPRSQTIVEADWLCGGTTMWRTVIPRRLGFWEGFEGYAQGEDLEFSLRARRHGRLICTRAARVLHLHEPRGRPNNYRIGYMAIRNRYEIHRRCLENRTWQDVAWFVYAWTLDSLLLFRYFFRLRLIVPTLQQCAGRIRAAFDLITSRE